MDKLKTMTLKEQVEYCYQLLLEHNVKNINLQNLETLLYYIGDFKVE